MQTDEVRIMAVWHRMTVIVLGCTIAWSWRHCWQFTHRDWHDIYDLRNASLSYYNASAFLPNRVVNTS